MKRYTKAVADFFDEISSASKLTDQELDKSFSDFADYFSDLLNAVPQVYPNYDADFAQKIFKEPSTDQEIKQIFPFWFFAANESLKRVVASIAKHGARKNARLIFNLLTDLYMLIADAEQVFRKNKVNYQSKRFDQTSSEIFEASFHVLRVGGPETLPDREIAPTSIFLIRQAIEKLGKTMLGYSRILDGNGNDARIKGDTLIPWEFTDHSNGNVILPIEVGTIKSIVAWSNPYVHTARLKLWWLVETAQFMLLPISLESFGIDYHGRKVRRPNIHIKNYRNVKRDFELYLENEANNKIPRPLKVEWIPEDYVEAVIESM